MSDLLVLDASVPAHVARRSPRRDVHCSPWRSGLIISLLVSGVIEGFVRPTGLAVGDQDRHRGTVALRFRSLFTSG
jgi:hypothetical protein